MCPPVQIASRVQQAATKYPAARELTTACVPSVNQEGTDPAQIQMVLASSAGLASSAQQPVGRQRLVVQVA